MVEFANAVAPSFPKPRPIIGDGPADPLLTPINSMLPASVVEESADTRTVLTDKSSGDSLRIVVPPTTMEGAGCFTSGEGFELVA